MTVRNSFLLWVTLTALPVSVHAEPAMRLHSSGLSTWVYPAPSKTGQQLGYLRPGSSVALKSSERRVGPGCPAGFVAIEPVGYVCLDANATLAADDRYVRAMALAQARNDALPYGYALSNGTPMYERLPTPEEWKREERRYGPAGSFRPQYWGNRGHEELAEKRAVAARGSAPFFLEGGGSYRDVSARTLVRRQLPHGSLVSYSRAFEHAGRVWLLSADGTVVPADRVRPFRRSEFRGVALPGPHALPVAWPRTATAHLYVMNEGVPRPGPAWPKGAPVPLDPEARATTHSGRTFWTTRHHDPSGQRLYVDARESRIVRAVETYPAQLGASEKWIWVSITLGALVAYEGKRPVFATLISPGAGGVPRPGGNLVKDSTTPLGSFRITFKHRTDDMSPEQGDQRSFWIADVPHTQYFDMPFALHAAYWHEDFGAPKSAGCVNLSPEDAAFLFDWTEPRLPSGWHGVIATPHTGPGTRVVITR